MLLVEKDNPLCSQWEELIIRDIEKGGILNVKDRVSLKRVAGHSVIEEEDLDEIKEAQDSSAIDECIMKNLNDVSIVLQSYVCYWPVVVSENALSHLELNCLYCQNTASLSKRVLNYRLSHEESAVGVTVNSGSILSKPPSKGTVSNLSLRVYAQKEEVPIRMWNIVL